MCCPALPISTPGTQSGDVLTLLVPENRPPSLDLAAPSPEPPPPPGLFDAAPALGRVPFGGADRSAAWATAGQAFTSALVDVLTGRRPPQQLSRWTTDEVLADLVMLTRVVHRHPVRPVHPYVQVVADAAAEVVVPCLPARGPWAPLRVVTARLDPYAGRWRCSHLGWISAPHRPATPGA